MKVILSPSKTKTLVGTPWKPLFDAALSKEIVSHMASLSEEQLKKALKIKEDKAEEVKNFFQNYAKEVEGEALSSYTGIAFKYLDAETLSEEGKAFAKEHLVVLSALYGIVTAGSPMKNYRLDLENPVYPKGESSLTERWKDKVSDYFKEEDWVLNLASKEYASLVSHPRLVTVIFEEEKSGVWKQLSTSSKMMRGQLARYVLEHQITAVEELPSELAGFYKEGIEEGVVRYRKHDNR